MTQTTWATTDDVSTLTGETVTTIQLATANTIIEVFARRIYSPALVARLGTRDVEWLRRAVAFQAVWIADQPDFWSRLDVTTITEGRKSIGLKEQTLLLAPMARIALSRCSWTRSRSIHIRSPFQDGMSPISADPDSGANDFYESWSSMSGG